MTALGMPFRPRRSDCIECSLAAGWHSVHPGQKLLSVHCCWAFHRTSIRRMRCSVVSIAWSQRAINPLISRCAVRNTPLSTCSSNPMSSRSSMVSSNWYCNLVAKSLTRWTKRSCWSKARTWSAVALRGCPVHGEGPNCRTALKDVLLQAGQWTGNTEAGKL